MVIEHVDIVLFDEFSSSDLRNGLTYVEFLYYLQDDIASHFQCSTLLSLGTSPTELSPPLASMELNGTAKCVYIHFIFAPWSFP